MITVYDVKTGEPVKLDSVDARQRVSAGIAVRNPEDLKQKEQEEKPVTEKRAYNKRNQGAE